MSVSTAPRPAASPVEARASAVVAALALVASLLIAPPWAGTSLPPGQAARLVDGALEGNVGDGWDAIPIGSFIAVGTRLRTPDDDAVLAVEAGTVTLARGTQLRLERGGYELTAGRVLSEVDSQIVAVAGTVRAEGRGTWRLELGVSPRVGVYRGGVGVSLQDTDRDVAVSDYEQVAIVDDAPADRPVPLRYLATDPWDARLLTEALAIDRQASQLRQGLQARYGSEDRPLGFYDDFEAGEGFAASTLAALAPRSSSGFGPPADVLLDLVVIDLLVRGASLDVDTAVDRVSTLRRDGATYGIVLRLHDLRAQDLLDAFEVALQRRADVVAANPPPTTEPTAPTSPSPTSGPSPSPGPTSSPSPGPTSSPSPEPSPSPSDDGVTQPIDDLIEPLPDPLEEPVDDLTDVIDDLADELPVNDPLTISP